MFEGKFNLIKKRSKLETRYIIPLDDRGKVQNRVKNSLKTRIIFVKHKYISHVIMRYYIPLI